MPVRFRYLALLLGAACAAPDTKLGRRLDGLREHLAPEELVTSAARRSGKLVSELSALPAEELARVDRIPRVGDRALAGVEHDLRSLKGTGTRVALLLGIDATPVPGPEGPDRATDPFAPTQERTLWARILDRIGW